MKYCHFHPSKSSWYVDRTLILTPAKILSIVSTITISRIRGFLLHTYCLVDEYYVNVKTKKPSLEQSISKSSNYFLEINVLLSVVFRWLLFVQVCLLTELDYEYVFFSCSYFGAFAFLIRCCNECSLFWHRFRVLSRRCNGSFQGSSCGYFQIHSGC